ncbi:MAG TPA: hypothetical protein VLC92_09640 [Rhodocyclaceae bacterium]|nr:hypothetical protein [Rhodocyclaceae bacterium]
MPQILDASPRISLRLYKTISRTTVDGEAAVSARYQGRESYIDLTPYLDDGSSVRTSKSVRDPAGAFSITFSDRPQDSVTGAFASESPSAIESIYGLVEPMDMIEIRMWGGVGAKPAELPIKMRGFVTELQRTQTMGQDGRPQRQVVISGQDYGKIWQMYQVVYLSAYAAGKNLLSTFPLWEMFGVNAVNTMSAADFVRKMVQSVINPFIAGFMPENSPMPKEIQTGDAIAVRHGMINNSYQSMQGSIYDILKANTDVGIWNELYIEDRADGVHCVYRPVPALKLSKSAEETGAPKDRKIQDDAIDPVVVTIPDSLIRSISSARSDATVANFFWVRNPRYDLIDDQQRMLASISEGRPGVSLDDYANAATKYYGTRPMYAETQMGEDSISNATSGQDAQTQDKRSKQMASWLDTRRQQMVDMNRDNVVLERGSAIVKGGPMRPDGVEAMKAGDYAEFQTGQFKFLAYVTQIEDEFMPFQGYTTTLIYERGEGFARRAQAGGGAQSPWLAEQVTTK